MARRPPRHRLSLNALARRAAPVLVAWGLAAWALAAAGAAPLGAAELVVQPTLVDDLKSVFGRVESRNPVAARARIGGSIVSIDVSEGDEVRAGQVIAVVADDKLKLRLDAVAANLRALTAQLDNARAELGRGEKLFEEGVIAKARIEQLRTQASVLSSQIAAETAERAVLVQQAREGQVVAPASGRVLAVPITPNSVLMPGETVATIAGGGYFLRIALPERHAAQLRPGDPVLVGERGTNPGAAGEQRPLHPGKLVKVYPEFANGFVLADVEVEGLAQYFVGERALVWIRIEQRRILAVPPAALAARHGIDYLRLATDGGTMEVAVVPGRAYDTPEGPRVEILSGLTAGDRVVVP